jgi:hypothetical protein
MTLPIPPTPPISNRTFAPYWCINAMFYIWALLTALFTIFCLVQYGINRVFKLAERGFHSTMFALLMLCGIFELIGTLMQLILFNRGGKIRR